MRTKTTNTTKKGDARELAGTADDLALLERFRWFRMALAERIAAESRSADEPVLALLRQEPTHQFAEFLYLIEGRLQITISNQRHQLDTGDVCWIDANTPRQYVCIGANTAKALIITEHSK